MNAALETLVYPYLKGILAPPGHQENLLFLNAEFTPFLQSLNTGTLCLMQPRFDKARPFRQSGHLIADTPGDKLYSTAWLLPGKDAGETQHLLALGLLSLAPGGTLVAAAANDAGGKRLAGFFEQLGLNPQEESKHKARVVFARSQPQKNDTLAQQWLVQGQEQPILDGSIISRPGLHSWDKVDAGSALLTRRLPPLSGHVADFGCGWGYLSLQMTGDITHLTLADVDARAIKIAEQNVKKAKPNISVATLWADLTHPERPPGPFDAIVMNPPFHDGTQAVPALGQAMIATAARALKKSGALYLVANRHLPYEKTLQSLFSRTELLADEQGFKVISCRL